jgi:hypothetical protein
MTGDDRGWGNEGLGEREKLQANRTSGSGENEGRGGVVDPTLLEMSLGLGVRFSPCEAEWRNRQQRQSGSTVHN